MSLVKTVSPEEASGRMAALYQTIEQRIGRVPNGVRVVSASPDLLEQHVAQLGYYMNHPTLGFPLQAFIRLLVSHDNDCAYCVGLNESMLMQRAGITPDQLVAAKKDPGTAPLAAKDLAMLEFVLKGTSAPKTVEPADLDDLRAHGWTDRDIVDALYHGARNVAMDIMFDALKVENDF